MEDSMEKIIKEKWNDILEFMKTEYNITKVAYENWLLTLSVHSVQDNTIIVAVEDSKATMIEFIKNKDMEAVFISTSWKHHVKMAIACMCISGFRLILHFS